MSFGEGNDDESGESGGGQRQGGGNNWNDRNSGGGGGYDRNNGGGGGGFRGQGGGYGGGGQQRGNWQGGGNRQGNGGGQRSWGNGGGGGGGFQKRGFGGGGNYNRQQEDTGPAKLYKPYVITGDRNTPEAVLGQIVALVKELEEFGFLLRSGGKEGPEEAAGAATNISEIHLPWKGFNGKDSKFTFTPPHATELAAMYHPSFDGLKPVIQTFLAQNVRMIMGKDLKSPALFIIGWSEDGAETIREKTARTGSFGHVIAVASAMKIKVFNLQKPDALARIKLHTGITPENEVSEPKENHGKAPTQFEQF